MEKGLDRYRYLRINKKNEGFSLVELIVVVLIMAIIATALTLAVTKYVAKAKRSADTNNAAELKAAVEMALMDGMTGASNIVDTLASGVVLLEFSTQTMEFSNSGSGAVTLSNAELTTLNNLIHEALGTAPIKTKVYPSEYFVVTVSKKTNGVISIEVSYSGHPTIHPLEYTN